MIGGSPKEDAGKSEAKAGGRRVVRAEEGLTGQAREWVEPRGRQADRVQPAPRGVRTPCGGRKASALLDKRRGGGTGIWGILGA